MIHFSTVKGTNFSKTGKLAKVAKLSSWLKCCEKLNGFAEWNNYVGKVPRFAFKKLELTFPRPKLTHATLAGKITVLRYKSLGSRHATATRENSGRHFVAYSVSHAVSSRVLCLRMTLLRSLRTRSMQFERQLPPRRCTTCHADRFSLHWTNG